MQDEIQGYSRCGANQVARRQPVVRDASTQLSSRCSFRGTAGSMECRSVGHAVRVSQTTADSVLLVASRSSPATYLLWPATICLPWATPHFRLRWDRVTCRPSTSPTHCRRSRLSLPVRKLQDHLGLPAHPELPPRDSSPRILHRQKAVSFPA